jgi:prepilin-type N-terminal cleavage/methylation domain-containing protein
LKPSRARGFTLVELAISLLIISLLIGMLVIPLTTQVDNQRISEARAQLGHVREAVLGFAVANGRLPCPATPATATGTAGAGLENKPGAACGITDGVLPWLSLGVPEADPWGRRFTYRVTGNFADDPSGMQATFLITENGNIRVTNGAVDMVTDAPAVIVSHGKNGFGAYQASTGVQLAGAAGDEAENADADGIFVSRTHAPDFDDELAWVSGNIVKSRMVAASRLP